MIGRSLVILVVVSLAAFSVVICSDGVSSLTTCVNTEVVGVRGSGQIYAQSPELKAIESMIPQSYKFEELDNRISVLNDLPPYAAVKVRGDLSSDLNGGVAIILRSSAGEYRKSVDSGKNLLKKYITNTIVPTDKCLVLVGYSQGAQVVNETMRDMHEADPNSLKNVIYIGLFGDPLYSPYGFNAPYKPAWLRGDALHPFYGLLFKDVGLPGKQAPDYIPRNPSNPKAPFTKVGSWCNYGDVICATNVTHYAAMRDGHGTYTGYDAEDMVDEIKAAVMNPDQNVTGAIWPSSVCGATKQDLVVLLDISAYMRRNKDLFTDESNTWDKKLIPGTNLRMNRTYGEQLLDSGCGDKRIAIVGFEGPSGQEPQLLLDFTSRAQDIDSLMDSLYEPSSGGVAERPQVREAAILAMEQSWRPDASRTLFAITPMAGAGPVIKAGRQTWASQGVINYHMNDEVGQQLISLSRQTRAAIIAAPQLPIDMSGFSVSAGAPSDRDPYTYFQVLSMLTGGYSWEKTFVDYPSRYTVKNVNFATEIQQFEIRRDATRVTMRSVRAKVGQPVTLELNDSSDLIASAAQRAGHGTGMDWYLDCDSLQKQAEYPVIKKVGSEFIFTPTKAGSCMAAVRVRTIGSGNGCYWGCPEPFPPYMLKTIPFKLEVRPADYAEKVPDDIITMIKTIYDDRVEFAWNPAAYGGDEEPVYLLKDLEGSVLAATTGTRAVVTDTKKQDADVLVQAIGADGRSQDFSSSSEAVQITDNRTPPESSVVTHALAVQDITSPPVVDAPIERLQGAAAVLSEGQTLGQYIEEPVIASAQIDTSHSVPARTSFNWLWIAPFVLLAIWGLSRAESAARKR